MFLNTDFLKSDELHLILQKTTCEDSKRGWLPAYHFSICDPSGQEMGSCTLRIGHNEQTYYGGNIGYTIYEHFRGHHYSGKACLLLFELARRHQMKYVTITCDPDNLPSRRNCEYAGGRLLEIAEIPEDSDLYQRGMRKKMYLPGRSSIKQKRSTYALLLRPYGRAHRQHLPSASP